jgi:hypothetical protein
MRTFMLISALCVVSGAAAFGARSLLRGGRPEARRAAAVGGAEAAPAAPPKQAQWRQQSVPLGRNASIIVFGPGGSAVAAGVGTLLLSRDDGRTWTELRGGPGDYRLTTDGGASYSPSGGVAGAATPGRVSVRDLCGVDSAVIAPSGRLYMRTSCEGAAQVWSVPLGDDSAPWHVVTFGSPGGDRDRGVASPVGSFVLAGSRVLTEANRRDRTVILTTDDDGATWTSFWKTSFFGSGFIAFDFIDADNGWMLLGDGELSRTGDGGRTWTRVAALPEEWAEDASAMKFADARNGYIVGDRGLVLATADGGATWHRRPTGVDTWFFTVAVADGGRKVWAAGDSRAVLESKDGGGSWSSIHIEALMNVYHRLTLKGDTAWVVSQDVIHHSD